MSLAVQKYGGTSVADAERIRNVARRIAARRQQGGQRVVQPANRDLRRALRQVHRVDQVYSRQRTS